MKKRILATLLACVMLLMAMPFSVSAAGTQDDPIDAATKWFGYGVDTYLLNPSIAEGATDGIWYTLTAENAGILFVEHSYKNVDYTIYVYVGDTVYEGGCVDGVPYNRPIHTYPLAVGDVATIQIVTKDAAAGTVYANLNIIDNDASNAIKVKSTDYTIYVAAGETVFFQDDSLQASYATQAAVLSGDSMDGVTFYNVTNNTNTGVYTMKAINDTDGDDQIELTLGGSQGSTGAPAIKPAWAVENASAVDKCFILTLQEGAHECNWDDDEDVDCNTCGAIREIVPTCQHSYDNNCDADCNVCGETREAPHYVVGDYACNKLCNVCWADLSTADHVFSCEIDNECDVCKTEFDVDLPLVWGGQSISEDVNGLACLFQAEVVGLSVDGNSAIYDDATFCGMKLVGMGAVVSNNFEETNVYPTQDDVDGEHVLDIPALNLWKYDGETSTASFAVRIINIPDQAKDTLIMFVPYVIVEDDEGAQFTLYIKTWAVSSTYNAALVTCIGD